MNDVDTLMQRIDTINAKTPDQLDADDIDTIIKFHRENRARRNAGEKPIKKTVDISAIMGNLTKRAEPSTPTFKRRYL
jgi:hypothetical protein